MSGKSVTITADLHIHSCLSPCASLDSSPSGIVRQAAAKGLQMIALSDHNCGDNLPAFFRCAEEAGLIPIAGMELTTSEETHLLALLPDLETAMEFSDFIYDSLPEFPFDPEKMGDQVVVDHNELVLDMKEKYLSIALPFDLEQLVEMIHERGGLAIPAHIDRFGYSVPSTLGFLPDLPFDAVESYQIPCPIDHRDYKVISDSDAHYLEDVGKRFTRLELESADFEGLKKYFKKKRGIQ